MKIIIIYITFGQVNKEKSITRYIANRAFGELRKFCGYLKYRQIVDLAFKNE